MKILIFSHEFPPKIGGAGIVANDIANSLCVRGHDITVITNDYNSKPQINTNIKFKPVKTIPKFQPYFYWKEIKKNNPREFDKIIINDIGAALTACLFFPEHLQKKCVVYLHGSEPEKIIITPTKFYKFVNFKKKIFKTISKFSFNNCS